MEIRALLEPLKRRIHSLVGRALIEACTDDGTLQRCKLQVQADQSLEDVPRVQQYGLTSVPKPGAEAVTVAIGGSRDHTIIIAVEDRRYRLKALEEGEVALYSDEGDKIHLKRDNTIEVTTKKFLVNTETASITNPQGELVTLVSDLVQAILDAKTSTSIGPQPLLNPAFTLLKDKIDSFKE